MKPGDKVVMVNCYEAKKYAGRIWTVESKPGALGGAVVVVKLAGYSGGFNVDYLRLVEEKE